MVFVHEISTKDVVTLGPRLEKNYLYPQKTNAQLAHIINNKNIKIVRNVVLDTLFHLNLVNAQSLQYRFLGYTQKVPPFTCQEEIFKLR